MAQLTGEGTDPEKKKSSKEYGLNKMNGAIQQYKGKKVYEPTASTFFREENNEMA